MLLKDIYLFRDIDDELVHFLIDNSRRVEYVRGDYVLHEGQLGDDNAYIIQEGVAEVEKDGEVIASLKSSQIFGEIALITNEPRTASIRALSDLVLLKINKDLLKKIIKEFKNGKEIQEELIRRINQNHKRK